MAENRKSQTPESDKLKGDKLINWWELPPVKTPQNSILLRWASEDEDDAPAK
jgi:hypothetical protein